MLGRLGPLALIVVFLGPMIFGDEPLPPPYHRLIVNGTVERISGGPRQNFVVTLVGQFSNALIDTTIELVDGFVDYQSEMIRAVTDTSGQFSLDVKVDLKPDSIALKVSAVDRESFVGPFFGMPETGIAITGEYESPTSGCAGCGTVEPATTIIKGYQYQFPQQTVVVPH